MTTSFNQVSSLVSEQLNRNGIDVDPTKAVLAMVTRLGSVAGFCGDKFTAPSASSNNNNNNTNSRGPSPNPTSTWSSLNAAEHRELKSQLGDLSVALFAVAASTGIDLGEATMASLGFNTNNVQQGSINNNNQQNNNMMNQQQQNNNNNNNQRSQSSTNYGSQSMPPFHQAVSQHGSLRNNANNNDQQQQPHSQKVIIPPAADASLNPLSVSNIRQYITHIRAQSRPVSNEEFADTGLVFAFEDPTANNSGNEKTLIQLCQNGHQIRVNSQNFDEFVNLFFQNLARFEASPQRNNNNNNNNNNQDDAGHTTPPRNSAFHPPRLSQEALQQQNNNGSGNNNGGLTSPGLRGKSGPGFEGEVVGHEDGAVIRRIKVDQTGHPDLQQEMACYSPSHQTFGLFSPQAKGNTIDVAYPEDTPQTAAQQNLDRPNQNNNYNNQNQQQQGGQDFGLNSPQAPNTSTIAFPSQLSLPPQSSNDNNGYQQQQNQSQQQGASSNASTTPAIVSRLANQGSNGQPSFAPLDPMTVASSEDHFNPRFLHLERIILDVEDQLAGLISNAGKIRQMVPNYLPKEEIASLSLVFAIPFKNKPFELTEGGQYMNVNSQNAKEYLTLVRDQRAIFEGRLSKKQSVKTFAVHLPHGGDTGRETGGFQSHSRAGDLTAPPESRTTFTFDTENDESLVPKVLQREKLPTLLPSASHYVAYLSANPERFPEMFKIMKSKSDMLSRWNVSYVVPDPGSTPPHTLQHATEHSARRCGVRELIPNGSSITVREQDADNFISLVLAVAPQLPGCLQPSP